MTSTQPIARGTPMSSRTVESPTGAKIEIVTDDDWCLTAGINPKSIRMWIGSKPLVVRELWEHGPATDMGGRATGVLMERIREHYPNTVYELAQPSAMHSLLSGTANAAAFHRKTKGKRTYEIELTAMPEVWYEKLRSDMGESMPTFAAIPVTTNGNHAEPIEATEPFIDSVLSNPDMILPVEKSLPEVYSPVIEVEIASQVAMELLTRVIEIVAAGDSGGMRDTRIRQLQTDMESVTGRLAQRLEENDRMRKQLRETGEELQAVKSERDSLRQRLRQTEANLNAALKGESAHAVTTEVMKRVDRIMRETPKPNQGDES